jgi:hypothetical protein
MATMWLTGQAGARRLQLRGALRAAVTPVSVTALAAQALGDHTHAHKKSVKGAAAAAAAAAVNPSTVTAIVEQLVVDGAVRGTLKSGAAPLAWAPA